MIQKIKNFLGFSEKKQEPKSPLVYGYYSSSPEHDLTGYSIASEELYRIYQYTPPITDCIDGNSEDIFSVGFEFFDPNNSKNEIQENTKRELNNIFSFYSFKNLKEQIYRDKHVAGHAFVLIVKNIFGNKILGFKPIDPRTMAIVSDIYGNIVKFIQRIGTTSAVVYEPDEILYFRNKKNIKNEVFGMSPIESIIWDAQTDNGAMLSNYYFFRNDAKPSNLFKLKNEFSDLSAESQKEVIDMVKDKYSGAEGKHKTGFINMVDEIVQLRITPEGMQELMNMRIFTRKSVYAKFRRPQFMDGYSDEVNLANGDRLYEIYWDNITQEEDSICEVFNNQFFKKIPELAGNVALKAKPRKFSAKVEAEKKTAMEEVVRGIITRLEYKKRFGIDTTDADNGDPMYDEHIIYQGASAIKPEDVGVVPQLPIEGQK